MTPQRARSSNGNRTSTHLSSSPPTTHPFLQPDHLKQCTISQAQPPPSPFLSTPHLPISPLLPPRAHSHVAFQISSLYLSTGSRDAPGTGQCNKLDHLRVGRPMRVACQVRYPTRPSSPSASCSATEASTNRCSAAHTVCGVGRMISIYRCHSARAPPRFVMHHLRRCRTRRLSVRSQHYAP